MDRYFPSLSHGGSGEIRTLTLPDDSQLVLNSHSAIDLDYNDATRTVELVRGELMATVAKAPDRPFRVITRDLTATALGTRYSVRLEDGFTRVAVQESSVSVTPRHGGDAVNLAAGQQADLNRNGVLARDAALALLADTLNLEVRYLTPWYVTVRPR